MQRKRAVKPPTIEIVVIIPGREQSVVSGRVARMIAWLCDNQNQIDSIHRGRADVSFSGDYQEWHVTETKAGY